MEKFALWSNLDLKILTHRYFQTITQFYYTFLYDALHEVDAQLVCTRQMIFWSESEYEGFYIFKHQHCPHLVIFIIEYFY